MSVRSRRPRPHRAEDHQPRADPDRSGLTREDCAPSWTPGGWRAFEGEQAQLARPRSGRAEEARRGRREAPQPPYSATRVSIRLATEHRTAYGYRAWRLPSSLHPTIELHSPLVFDIVDVWNSRSISGCTYHVGNPGGWADDRFPANASEADARRASRFFPSGHTPERIEVADSRREGEYPRTLDLRR
jgi:hypothetical protein